MIVTIQQAKAVATKSVGEKLSAFPLLSNGASVIICVPEKTCMAVVLNSP
jgi:hypothetical protein